MSHKYAQSRIIYFYINTSSVVSVGLMPRMTGGFLLLIWEYYALDGDREGYAPCPPGAFTQVLIGSGNNSARIEVSGWWG